MGTGISDEQIRACLQQQRRIGAAALEKVWKRYQMQKNAQLKLLQGTLCWVDADGVLQFRRFPGNEPLFRIPLLKPEFKQTESAQPPKDWEIAWLDGEDGGLQAERTLPAEVQPGLLIAKQGCFLHYPGFEHESHLGLSFQLLDRPADPQQPRNHFDLYVSPDKRYLLAIHRESGELTLISLEQLTRLKSVQLLGKGSTRALNVAFDIHRKSAFKAYLTDNQGQYLHVLDLSTMHASPWAAGLGPLGNLQLSRDRQQLFLLTFQPQLSLKVLDKDQLKPLRSFKAKGVSLCQQGDRPQDLMVLAPEAPLLMLMSHLEEMDNLPVIQVMDIVEGKTLKRYSLKNLKAPDLLVCGLPNPLQELGATSLEELVLEEGLMSEDDWDEMMRGLEADQRSGNLPDAVPAADAALPGPAMPAQGLEPIKMSKSETEEGFKAPEPLQQDPEILDQIDKDGEPISLPPDANEAIFRLFVWYFYQITLTNLEIHGPELYKLRKVAAKTRKRLESKQAVMVVIPAILGKYTLELPISRKMVFRFLEEMRQNQAQSYSLNLCPNCRAVMRSEAGCPQCPDCGLALDLPAEKSWRRLVSAEHSSHLPAGQMLFVLREAQRMLVMTPWHQPLFVFDTQAAGIRGIGDAVVLPNLNFLVTDTAAKKISEYSTGGQLIWSSRLPLKQPLTTTVYLTEDYEERFLTVDLGLKEVIESNRKGQILRKYPDGPGQQPLISPFDVQRTPENHWLILDRGSQKVLEIGPNGATVQSWGPENGLTRPIFARRLSEGETLIVDADGARILIFDAFNALNRSLRYWPPEGEAAAAWAGRPAPERVMRMHNGELLLVGQDFYLLCRPDKGTLRGPFRLSQNPDAEKTLIKLQVSVSDRSIDKQQQLAEQSRFLKQIPLLEETTEKQRLTIAEHLVSLRFKAGETILAELSQSNALYFIIEGQIELSKPELVIKELGNGDVFGETGLVLGDKKSEVSARARTNCHLLMLERAAFKKVILRFPKFFHLVRSLAMERQALLKRYQDAKSQAMTDMLAHKLMVNKVSQHPLFRGKGAHIYEALAQCLTPVAFMPNQVIYRRGETAGNLYLITEGQIGVVRRGEHRPSVVLTDGQILGEMAFFTGNLRTATVTTLDFCKMLEMEYKDLQALVGKHIWLKAKLEQMVRQRHAQNQADLEAFEQEKGITRPDLPRTQAWSLMELQEDELVFLPALEGELVMGAENSGEVLWCSGREPQIAFSRVARLLPLGDAIYITDAGQQKIIGLDINTRQTLMIWQNKTHGLKLPRSTWVTRDQLLLVADEGGSRLLMLDQEDHELWAFESPHEIMNPTYAEETPQGTILFADAGLHKVYEISREGEVLWSYGQLMIAGDGPGELNTPAYCHRLESGETLIGDQGNDRLVIVSRQGQESALYYGTDEHPLLQPYHCEVRENGDILVYSIVEDRVVRLDLWGEPIWSLQVSPADASAPALVTAPAETAPAETAPAQAQEVLRQALADALDQPEEPSEPVAEATAHAINPDFEAILARADEIQHTPAPVVTPQFDYLDELLASSVPELAPEIAGELDAILELSPEPEPEAPLEPVLEAVVLQPLVQDLDQLDALLDDLDYSEPSQPIESGPVRQEAAPAAEIDIFASLDALMGLDSDLAKTQAAYPIDPNLHRTQPILDTEKQELFASDSQTAGASLLDQRLQEEFRHLSEDLDKTFDEEAFDRALNEDLDEALDEDLMLVSAAPVIIEDDDDVIEDL